MPAKVVEVRCPYGFQRLFAKIRVSGEAIIITPDGLWEFSCNDCARDLRKEGSKVVRVLHRYNFEGEFTESERVY